MIVDSSSIVVIPCMCVRVGNLKMMLENKVIKSLLHIAVYALKVENSWSYIKIASKNDFAPYRNIYKDVILSIQCIEDLIWLRIICNQNV